MKKKNYLLLIAFCLCFSFSALPKNNDFQPKLKFYKDTVIFDTITEGEKINISFTFKVIDKNLVKIHQVYTGCSCTATDYPKDSMENNNQYSIDVVFDSKDWGLDSGNYVK